MGRRLRIVIVGAGIGGLTAARALRLRGHEVALFERAATLGEVGAGLQVGPSAVKVLYALGLGDRLNRIACAPESFSTFNWSDGALVHREPFQDTFKRYGAPYLTAHRADLHQLLAEGASGAAIHVGRPCVSVASTEKGAVASFADGSSVECDALIGADGIRSVVRETLWGKETPRYTHYMGWRGVVPMEQALAAIGEASAEIHRRDITLWRSPTGVMLFYPLRAGALLNVFGGRYTDEWAEESWTLPSSRAELLSAFEGWPRERLAVFDLLPEVFKWGIFDRDPLPRWSKGNVSLLGDAAHPMMPTLAQGAAIAIEDAFVLARHLDNAASGVAAALTSYQDERIARASRVQILARDQFEDNRRNPPPAPRDRTWIFEHDVTRARAA